MQKHTDDLATTLLTMPQNEVQEFVRTSVRNRNLRQVVSRLNQDVMSGNASKSKAASAALQKIGFTD